MKRAEKIPNGEESPYELKYGSRVVPDWNFTCNGNITSLLLGVEIEEDDDDDDDHVPQYPEVQIWRRVPAGDVYQRIDSRMIVMSSGNYNPGGVLRYELNPPLSVTSGDVLGVYQPNDDAVVELYYRNNDPEAPIAYGVSGSPTNFFISNATILSQQYILLSAITGIMTLILTLFY